MIFCHFFPLSFTDGDKISKGFCFEFNPIIRYVFTFINQIHPSFHSRYLNIYLKHDKLLEIDIENDGWSNRMINIERQ